MSQHDPSLKGDSALVLIGACGLKCHECNAYKATQANDPEAIARTAAEWRERHGGDIKPEDVWCDGCMSPGDRRCGWARQGCPVRACAVGRGVANCAVCDDYGCEKMMALVGGVPQMQETLEAIRAGRLQPGSQGG